MSVFSKLQLSLGINMSAFVVAWLLRTEKFFDATGALTFITLVVKSLLEKDGAPITQRQVPTIVGFDPCINLGSAGTAGILAG